MKIIDILIEQCKEPKGSLGNVMIRTMEIMDAGLNRWVLEKIECTSGNLLDIGCGGGKTIYVLSKMYPKAKLFGIDYSEEAVKASKRKNRQRVEEGSVVIQQSSVSSMPFSNESFNHVIAIRTHYFWPNLEKDTQEVFRILNKKGKFLIFSETYKIDYHMEQYNTDDSIHQLLIDTGFQSVQINKKNQCICIIAEK